MLSDNLYEILFQITLSQIDKSCQLLTENFGQNSNKILKMSTSNHQIGKQAPIEHINAPFSNNGADYATYNPKVEGTLQYISKDGSLSRKNKRRLYRNKQNKLINKKSQKMAKHYVSPYSKRAKLNRRNMKESLSRSVSQRGGKDKEKYLYEEIYSHRPNVVVKSRKVIHTAGVKHVERLIRQGADGRKHIITKVLNKEPETIETVEYTNPYPETKHFMRATEQIPTTADEDIPGRRRYEKLPEDVRERDQRRIPSPGHKITYDPVFGLAGETLRRPPNNMEEWLKHNYAKEISTDSEGEGNRNQAPFEFRVPPEPVEDDGDYEESEEQTEEE